MTMTDLAALMCITTPDLCSDYRGMLRTARYCYGKLSVRLSVRNVEVS